MDKQPNVKGNEMKANGNDGFEDFELQTWHNELNGPRVDESSVASTSANVNTVSANWLPNGTQRLPASSSQLNCSFAPCFNRVLRKEVGPLTTSTHLVAAQSVVAADR
ncbi:hypothetical protein niasHS_016249 [Heterodera schachtii]|uniref:Uncharacterized protein n=1 Tax=Heterodera schachtii TaxID=97005 RepID=A0ABD2HQE7_HETSC